MDCKVTHIPEKNKLITEVDGSSAWVEYVIYEDYLNIIHTYVPSELRGQGIASALVEATYKYALENNLKPQATCSYAVMWLNRHPEYME